MIKDTSHTTFEQYAHEQVHYDRLVSILYENKAHSLSHYLKKHPDIPIPFIDLLGRIVFALEMQERSYIHDISELNGANQAWENAQYLLKLVPASADEALQHAVENLMNKLLIQAASENNTKRILDLVQAEYCFHPDLKKLQSGLAMSYCIKQGAFDVLKLFLTHSVFKDVFHIDMMNGLPLQCAIDERKTKLALWLLEGEGLSEHANIHLYQFKTIKDKTHSELIRLLHRKGYQISTQEQTELMTFFKTALWASKPWMMAFFFDTYSFTDSQKLICEDALIIHCVNNLDESFFDWGLYEHGMNVKTTLELIQAKMAFLEPEHIEMPFLLSCENKCEKLLLKYVLEEKFDIQNTGKKSKNKI